MRYLAMTGLVLLSAINGFNSFAASRIDSRYQAERGEVVVDAVVLEDGGVAVLTSLRLLQPAAKPVWLSGSMLERIDGELVVCGDAGCFSGSRATASGLAAIDRSGRWALMADGVVSAGVWPNVEDSWVLSTEESASRIVVVAGVVLLDRRDSSELVAIEHSTGARWVCPGVRLAGAGGELVAVYEDGGGQEGALRLMEPRSGCGLTDLPAAARKVPPVVRSASSEGLAIALEHEWLVLDPGRSTALRFYPLEAQAFAGLSWVVKRPGGIIEVRSPAPTVAPDDGDAVDPEDESGDGVDPEDESGDGEVDPG